MNGERPVTEDDLHAYIDDALDFSRRRQVEASAAPAVGLCALCRSRNGRQRRDRWLRKPPTATGLLSRIIFVLSRSAPINATTL
jgi:hypothetical protein